MCVTINYLIETTNENSSHLKSPFTLCLGHLILFFLAKLIYSDGQQTALSTALNVKCLLIRTNSPISFCQLNKTTALLLFVADRSNFNDQQIKTDWGLLNDLTEMLQESTTKLFYINSNFSNYLLKPILTIVNVCFNNLQSCIFSSFIPKLTQLSVQLRMLVFCTFKTKFWLFC